jgi:hypothetical protein
VTFLFLKKLVRNDDALTAKLVDTELNMLLERAHRRYQNEVLTSKKLYQRYVADFVNGITYTDATAAFMKNCHNVCLHIMKELLYERVDLVREYFTRPIAGGYRELLCKFNTTTFTHHHKAEPVQKTFQINFSEAQYEILQQYMSQLKLFCATLTMEEVKIFFDCRQLRPRPKSSNNRTLAKFFSMLSHAHFITGEWAAAIDINKLIEKPNSTKTLRHTDLSSALTASHTKDYEANHRDDLNLLREMIKALQANTKPSE